jgi:hypothetical protein
MPTSGTAQTPVSQFLSGVLGGNANSSYEPQRVSGALLHVTGIGNGAVDTTFTAALKSFPLPKWTNTPQIVGYLNEKRKFAGNPEFDDLSVSFQDYVDLNTAQTLLAWDQLVYDPNAGTIGLKANYARTGLVQMFAPDGSFTRQYHLIGMWPSSFDHGEIEQGGDDLLAINVGFAIDKAIPDAGLQPVAAGTTSPFQVQGNGQ